MNLLLDTHTLIWFLEGDANLSAAAKEQIENSANTNFVSVATFWEIAIKVSLFIIKIRLIDYWLHKL